jgi:hypothetical protein
MKNDQVNEAQNPSGAQPPCCRFIYGTHVQIGWGCCNGHYNGLQRDKCKFCEHERCTPLIIEPDLKHAIYCEEGGRTRVEIVTCWFEDHKEGEGWRDFNLRLRAVGTLQSGHFGDIPSGTEFSVSVNVEYINSAMRNWYLETDTEGKQANAAT